MERTYGKNKKLHELEDLNNLEIQSQIFMCNLKVGDQFSIGERQFEVKTASPKSLKIVSLDKSWTFRPDFFEKYGVWITSPRAKSKKADGSNFLRDIEGILMIDSINQYNPFHTPSKIFEIVHKDYLFKI